METGKANQDLQLLVENFKEEVNKEGNEALKEALFMEAGNNMETSTSSWTTKIARSVLHFSVDKFDNYYDAVRQWTPEELGGIDGAGVYKVPKVAGANGGMFADDSDNTVTYAVVGDGEMTVDTNTFYSAIRINRRLLKRGAKGVVKQFLEETSAGVHRTFITKFIDFMIAGVAAANVISTGVSVDNLMTGISVINDQFDANDVALNLAASHVLFSVEGFKTFQLTDDYKLLFTYNQGSTTANIYTEFTNWNGVKVSVWKMMGKKYVGTGVDRERVQAMVVDSMNFLQIVKEGGVDIYSGRIPKTAGDEEHIFAQDAGYAIAADVAGLLITVADAE